MTPGDAVDKVRVLEESAIPTEAPRPQQLEQGATSGNRESAIQTTLVNSTFESGSFAGDGWTVANGAQTNKWFVGTVPGNGPSTAGTNAAYISNNATGTTYNYDVTATSVVHFYRDVTFPAGETIINLTFDWKGQGENSTGQDQYDYLRVFLSPTSTTPVAGTQVAFADSIGLVKYNLQGTYITATITVNAANAGTTKRLIFSWNNDNSAGAQPPAAVDNIVLTSQAPVPLAGVKTIDNTMATGGNNYNSFTAAINDLNLNGTGSGGVTFNVAPGQSFAETTPCVTASGTATDQIVFQKGGAGVNPQVRPTGGAGAVDFGLCISGSDFITFDGIDVNIASGSAVEYGYLVRNASATNGAQNNTVQNTSVTLNRANTASVGILQSSDTLGGGVTPTTVGGANSNNHYYNLSIQNVYSGIYLRTLLIGGDTNNEVGVTGGGTTIVGGASAGDIGFGSVTTWGIRALGQTNVKIFKTEVRNVGVTGAVLVDGIFLDQTAGTSEAYGNNVHGIVSFSTTSTTGVNGIRSNTTTATSGNVNRVYNNFVWEIFSSYTGTASATRQIKGIFVQQNGSGAGNTQHIDFNSVRIDGQSSLNISSTAFAIGTTSGPVINVRNNIFANVTPTQAGVAKHYTWESTSATLTGIAGSISDHNVLYIANTTNGFIGLGNATDRATITDWRNATGQDFHSKSSNPQFMSPTNLHINPALATDVESGGSYFNGAITWVIQDIDMQARNATFPDIGADEGTFTAADTMYPDIFLPTVTNSTNTTSRTLTATIIDPSGVPIAGMGLPVLYFRKGAVGGFTAVQGVHAGGNNYSFTITYASVGGVVAGDVIQFYIVAQDNLNNVGSLPAVGAASFTANPPAAGTPPTTPFSYTIVNGFSGTINVPGSFASLTNAGGLFAAINGGVLTGDVVVNITSDLTGELGTVSLNQFSDEGGGSSFTLTIQPSGARIISGSNTTALINLNGADRTIFNGLNTGGNSLLIRNTSATTGAVIQLTNDASNNSILNCVIEGSNTSTSSALVLIGAGTTTGNDNNLISSSIITNRSDGGGTPANLIASLNASTTALNSNNTITGNQLVNFTSNGFSTSAAVSSNNWTFTNNDITQTTGRNTTIFGLNLGGMSGTNLVSGNGIHGFTTSGTNTALGILIGNASNLTISRNRIYDFQATPGATGLIEGIEFDGVSGGTPSVTIVNNMVALAPSPATAQPVIGIQDFGFTGNVFTAYYNSIYIGGTATGSASSWALRRGTVAPTTYTARNNIAFNNRTGGTGNHFAGGDQSANTGTFVSDYNFYAGTGATPANFMDYGTSSSGTPVSFSTWQTGLPSRDANSIANTAATYTVNTFFDDAAIGDLHLQATAPVLGAGTQVTGINNDFDNDLRDNLPDIGADELPTAGRTGIIPAGTYRDANIGTGSLGGDVTITGALTFSGILSTGSFTLTVDCGASATGGSSSSFVDGNLRKNYCSAENFTYPVGTTTDGNEYSPATANVTAATNPSSLTVNANKGTPGGITDATALDRFWTLTETGSITADLTFSYLQTDVDGNEANYRVVKVEGGTASNFPEMCPAGPCVDEGDNTITAPGVTSFSDWLAAEPNAPTSIEANVGGRIVTNNGQPLSGVLVNLLDTQLGQTRTSMTDANGDYQFGSVLTGRDILVTPARQGYTFSPQNQVFSHTGERLNVNFIATADTTQARAVANDFDGDGKSDLAVFRPSDATWYILQSSNGVMQAIQWGLGSDRIVPADYDGDRKTDVAVFRPSTGTWHIYQSATQTVRSVQWGIEEDVVMPADFDGDDKADLTVFRPSTGAWYILESQTGQMRAVNWGTNGDRPVAADYDNDGKADIAVFRPSTGTWYIVNSSNNSQRAENWGVSTDRPATGDFDGDHKADLAVFRPENGYWYVFLSADGSISAKAHGTGADRPVPADYDGDGKTDRAVWQQADGNWLILRSSTNASSGQLWGTSGDVPAPSAYVP